MTRKLAVSALLTALSVVLIWFAAIIPTGSAAVVAVAGVLGGIALIECGYAWATLLFAATAILSFILVPDIGVSAMFAAMFGWYPLVKSAIERRCRSHRTAWVLKTLVAYAAAVVLIGAFMLLNYSPFYFDFGGELIISVLIVGGFALAYGIVFVLYDRGIGLLYAEYVRRRSQTK